MINVVIVLTLVGCIAALEVVSRMEVRRNSRVPTQTVILITVVLSVLCVIVGGLGWIIGYYGATTLSMLFGGT